MESNKLNDVEKHVLTSLITVEYCVQQHNANPDNAENQRETRGTYEFIADNFAYTTDDVVRAMLFLNKKGYVVYEEISDRQFRFELNHKKIEKDFPSE